MNVADLRGSRAGTDLLLRRTPRDLVGLWTLLQAAEMALVRLACIPTCGDAVVVAQLDVREAMGEIDWIQPELEHAAITVDLGEASPGEDPILPIRGLLAAAKSLSSGLAGSADLADGDEAMLARVEVLVDAASRRLADSSS